MGLGKVEVVPPYTTIGCLRAEKVEKVKVEKVHGDSGFSPLLGLAYPPSPP